MIEEKFINKFEKDLMQLHKRMTELEKLEIERQRTGKPYWKIEKEYQSIFQLAKEGMAIVQDGIVVRANLQLEQIVGYSPEELIGNPFKQYIHPDDLLKVTEYYNERMAGKEAPIIYKLKVMHKNGNEVEVETKMAVIPYHGKPADFAIVTEMKK